MELFKCSVSIKTMLFGVSYSDLILTHAVSKM